MCGEFLHAVSSTVLSGPCSCRRSSGKRTLHEVALPHPQTRYDHKGKENKSRGGSVARELIEGTVNVSHNRNRQDQVDPAKNGARCSLTHDLLRSQLSFRRGPLGGI